MRRRSGGFQVIATAVTAASIAAQAQGALAQTISPPPPPAPIGKTPPEHSREWRLQHGYQWDGHDWVMKLAQRPESQPPAEPAPAQPEAQHPAANTPVQSQTAR